MDVDPVPAAILLVKDGSGGDKLLFKYPYCTCYSEFVEKEDQEKYGVVHEGRDKLEDSPKGFSNAKNKSENHNDSVRSSDLHSRSGTEMNVHEDTNVNTTEGKMIDRKNKHFSDMTEASGNVLRPSQQYSGLRLNDAQSEFSSDAINPFAFTDPESDPFAALDGLSSSINDQGHLTGFSDKALSNLLAVKTDMCGCRFELTVKNVRFIGYPILMDPHKKTSLQMFHLALALDARLEPEVVNGYYSLCKRLAVGLKYMDTNKRYLSSQCSVMIAAHEQDANRGKLDKGSPDPYDEIAKQSDLARHLIAIYNMLYRTGECIVNLDNWFNVSFVMPYKAYANMPVGSYFSLARVWRRRRRVQRYMSVLLLRERRALVAAASPPVSPTVRRLMDVLSPTSTLSKIAADADLIHSHVVDVVGHYIHWGHMMVIYPVCAKNLYVMSSKAPEIISQHGLCGRFEERFPKSGLPLYQVLQLFRSPLSPHEFTECALTLNKKYEGFFTILWLLEHCLITQLHTYVFLSVPTRGVAAAAGALALSGLHTSLGSSCHVRAEHEMSFGDPLAETGTQNFCGKSSTDESRTISVPSTIKSESHPSNVQQSSSSNSQSLSSNLQDTIISSSQSHSSDMQLDTTNVSNNQSHSGNVLKDTTNISNNQSHSNTPQHGTTNQVKADGSTGHYGPPSSATADQEEEAELLALLQKSALTPLERCAALTLYASHASIISLDDLRTFVRLSEYFRGRHHVEEMMYATNLPRSRILDTIDKFRLMLCVVEWPATNYPVCVE